MTIVYSLSPQETTPDPTLGVLGPLTDKGTPLYIKITPLHLATTYSFIGVSRTNFDFSLSGISTEG